MRSALSMVAGLSLGLLGTHAFAGVCDYKPSALLGGGGAAAAGGVAAGTAATGAAATAAGFYTLTNATTGLTMLGSTLAGSSGAGTIGIIGGTSGLVGSAAAVIMAPATIIAGAVAAVGLGAYEGACVFTVDRITDPAEIDAIVRALAADADPEFFRLTTLADGREGIMVRAGDDVSIYAIEDLYIADEVLKHRDWLRNTAIGSVSWVELVPEEN